jgi:hypothetical protein
MKIVFDLDGVLRDLNGYLHTKFGIPDPQEWFWKHQGKDIYQWIAQDNLAPLVYSPATDYEKIASFNFECPEIWTCQPDDWIPKTKLWLQLHFPQHEVRYLSTNEKRQWLDNEKNTWLVEDSPNFSHYDRILLIDRPYNRHLKDVIRIHNPEELNSWILKLLESNTIAVN